MVKTLKSTDMWDLAPCSAFCPNQGDLLLQHYFSLTKISFLAPKKKKYCISRKLNRRVKLRYSLFACLKTIFEKEEAMKVLITLEIDTGAYFIHVIFISFLKYYLILVSTLPCLNSYSSTCKFPSTSPVARKIPPSVIGGYNTEHQWTQTKRMKYSNSS